MKKPRIFQIVLIAGLVSLAGCGKEEQRQQEVVREFERTFALEPAPTTAPAQPSTSPGTYSSPAPRGGTSPATTGTGTSPTTEPLRAEVSPVVQEAAQEVVHYINNRQYASAVQRLDGLMREPTLTADQWIASRNAMAELQSRIARDASISDEERDQVRRVLERGR